MPDMSALLEELKKQTRLLTAQEKATLARILIEGLDASTDSNVEQLWVAESQRRYEAYLKIPRRHEPCTNIHLALFAPASPPDVRQGYALPSGF